MAFDWMPNGLQGGFTRDNIRPTDVLYKYDGPIIYVSGFGDNSVLCYKLDEEDDSLQFLVVPTNKYIIDRIKTNKTSLRYALAQAWVWVVTIDHQYKINDSVQISFDEIPEKILPRVGIGLLPTKKPIDDSSKDYKPFLSIHFRGGDTKSGTLPYSVVLMHLTQVFHSIWKIYGHAVFDAAPDASEKLMRRALTVPIHQPAFASLLIELDKPELDFSDITKRPRVDMNVARDNILKANDIFLTDASLIAQEAQRSRLSTATVADMRDTFDIIASIAPHADSYFKSVAVFGLGIDTEREFVIDARIGQEIKHVHSLTVRVPGLISGTVMEVNWMSKTFVLRSRNFRQTTCVPTSERMADAILNLQSGAIVEVEGSLERRTRRDKLLLRRLAVRDGPTTYA